ncbi:MAG TPA: substrate-binding domain-containing protein [Deinococcales bacterium]|nr:substrate-binding domain-containing protein [Deinococcales bacterium]
MSKPVTLNDVARLAGVSPSTVSRILNGTANVTPERRTSVEDAIQRLGFRPNLMAQSLARGRSMSIGVLTQDISSPFYGATLSGIEEGLIDGPYHPVFISGHWREAEESAALDVLLSRHVDGLIVLGGHTPDEHLIEVSERLPLVAVGRRVEGLEDRCLYIDNVLGSYRGTRHLIDLGHRRIAYIAGRPEHRDALDRLAGYRKALAEAGIPEDPDLIAQGDFLEQSGLLAMSALLSRSALFSAIVAANDQMAYGARLGLYRMGIRVPDDISIVGYDDLPGSAFATPPLTTVRQPTHEMGLAAARMIVSILGGNETPRRPAFEAELIVRESTALNRAREVPTATSR